jgi:hypothetical protein
MIVAVRHRPKYGAGYASMIAGHNGMEHGIPTRKEATGMDLGFLRSLYEEAPDGARWASVYLDTTPTVEIAGAELELRWRAARQRLAADGADEATLDAVGEALSGATHDIRGQAVFAADGAVRLSVHLPSPPQQEISRYSPLPHVMPLLAQLPARAPHVRVAAARGGAEVVGVPIDGTPVRQVTGSHSWPVHKVSASGMSEYHLQRSVEETWFANAKEAAAAAVAAADRVGAEFVVVGGDARERGMLIEVLPARLRDNAVIVDRETAAAAAAFDEAAAAEAARRVEAASRARLDEFRARMDVRDLTVRRAAEGLSGTLAALRDGLAQDVLLADDPSSTATAWAGPGPDDVAATAEELGAGETGGPVRDRADAVLSRAATRTDAGLFFVPPDAAPLRDGMGALLRAPMAAV